jgi:hypothetical protein
MTVIAPPFAGEPDDDWRQAVDSVSTPADVVDLDVVRTRRAAPPRDPDPDDDLTGDAESVDETPPGEGGPVDAAGEIVPPLTCPDTAGTAGTTYPARPGNLIPIPAAEHRTGRSGQCGS